MTKNVLCLLAGDFAVLLKAGMTVKQAVLYNALSAMLAYLGMATGILIGHYADNVSMWIFALTAGLFMYVALVDMVSTVYKYHWILIALWYEIVAATEL